MSMKNRFTAIKEIAEANPYGFTISIIDFQTPKKGYCVAMRLTQDSFGDEGLKRVIEIAEQSTFTVGGWFDERDNRYYYDCVMIVNDLQEALKIGRANEQLAIYSLDENKEIRL